MLIICLNYNHIRISIQPIEFYHTKILFFLLVLKLLEKKTIAMVIFSTKRRLDMFISVMLHVRRRLMKYIQLFQNLFF